MIVTIKIYLISQHNQLTTSFPRLCFCTVHMYAVVHLFCVTFCGLFELRRNCVGFVCLIISITIGDTIIKKFWIPLTGLTLPRFVSVSNKALDFHRQTSWIVFVFVVCFVDICGIVDHHCLHSLFTIDNARFEQSPIVPNMVISKLNITVAISEV